MRIIQFCTKFGAGGIARHAVDLGLWLRTQGHEVVFAGAPGEVLDSEREKQFIPLSTDRVSGHAGMFRRVGSAWACSKELRNFLKDARVDLIHCHESAPAIVARLASRGMKIPVLLTYHGSEPERIRQFAMTGKFTAQQVITPSHRSASDLISRGGLPESKVRVIGLGIKTPPPADAAKVESLRRDLLGEHGKILVVVVARIAYQKGIDILVRVVRRINQRRQDIRVVVVGGGELRDDMEELSVASGTGHLIHFAGHIDEPRIYLDAADLFLLTSRWEALPISIVEAFRAGLPVVAADTSGVEELVDSSVGAVLPIGDEEAFAEAVLRICNDDQTRKDMSVAALERSREDRFSPDHIHRIFEMHYEQVLAGEIR
jgi:glycosyltransferase involved in cell wall biosynthesis